jgi:xanthine dehydrogenase accessory factor
MNEIFYEICRALLIGQELAVATIISDRGSTPRTSGSRMIVYPDGDISGTIGGGAVEGDVIQRALRLFDTQGA